MLARGERLRRWGRDAGRQGAPLVVLLVVAFASRAHWLTLSTRELIVDVLPDDAFYYFQIARRFDLGEGITFDGTAAATGLHYAWLLLIAPLFIGAAPGATTPIHGALVLATISFGVAAWLLYLCVEKLSERRWLAAIAAGVFSLQPWLRRESMNGLETALSLAAIMTAIWALLRYWEMPRANRAYALGAALVFSFFARSDSLVLLAPACAPLLLGTETRKDALRAGATTLGAVVLTSLTNWMRTGSILQSSASAVPWLFKSNWLRLHPNATPADVRLQSWRAFDRAIEMVTFRVGILPWIAGGLAAAAIVVVVVRTRRGPALPSGSGLRPAVAPLAPLLTFLGLGLGFVALVFVHGYVRWLPRSWYFASAPAIALLVIAAATRALSAWPHAGRVAAGIYAAIAAADLTSVRPEARGPTYPWQEEMFVAATQLDLRVPRGASVGAFNSGIFGYHSSRVVVNLDGIVNEDASRALQGARLLAYMRERSVRYVVDSPGMWNDPKFMHATLHLWGPNVPAPRVIERFDVPGTGWPRPTDAIVLAEVPSDEAVPEMHEAPAP